MVSHAQLERRLAKLEEAFRLNRRIQRGCIKLFFIPKDCEDQDAFKAQCISKTPKGLHTLIIEFVRPEGGDELGTGPLTADQTDICDDDTLE